jgi:hypothetical protein
MAADGLTVRRLYIDSRFRATGSTDDFEMQLTEGIELPANAFCFLSEFTGVVSWETVNESNRNLYVGENVGGASSYRIVQLPLGAHDSESLRAALQDSLNAGRPSGLGVYSVTRSSSASATNTINLGSAAFRYYTVSVGSGAFCILSDALLESPSWYVAVWQAGGGAPYDTNTVKSSNELFQFAEALSFQASHVSKFVDLRSKHSLFLHSSLGNNDSVGSRGLRSILGKIPVDSSYGSIVHFQHGGSPYDMVSCGPSTLQLPRFWLRDARNQRVDLMGGHWSATIVFSTM